MKHIWLLPLLLYSVSILATHRPILFFPGWGPRSLTDTKDLQKFFVQDGQPKKQIHQFFYPYKEDLDTIRDHLIEKLRPVIAQYPPDTRFDVITHSLGQIAGFYALLEGGWGSRIENFIGLDGTIYGQEELPDYCVKMPGLCKAHRKLVPYKAPFIMGLVSKYAQGLPQIKKCSLYIVDDKTLYCPHDSGNFEDGIHVALTEVSHMDLIHKRALYHLMREECRF